MSSENEPLLTKEELEKKFKEEKVKVDNILKEAKLEEALKGYNDLATLFPEIALDWDYEKNKNVNIRLIKPGSQQKIWWKCVYCGKGWMQTPNRKINTKLIDIAGCPECRCKYAK